MSEQGPYTAIELIAAERAEQVAKHGWTPEHDDGHRYGELAINAAALAVEGTDFSVRENNFPERQYEDDWGLVKKLKGDRIHALKVAGALIAAELDRELRAKAKTAGEQPSQSSTEGLGASASQTGPSAISPPKKAEDAAPVPGATLTDDEQRYFIALKEIYHISEMGSEIEKYCIHALRITR